MVNKKEKKDALKKMLNEKTLLEMSGGGKADWPNAFDIIPNTVKLENNTSGTQTVGNVLGQLAAINTSITATNQYLSSDVSTRNTIKGLVFTNTNRISATKLIAPGDNFSGQLDATKGLPLYIADQVSKATGSMTGTSIYTQLDTSFKTNGSDIALSNPITDIFSKITYPFNQDKDDLTATFNGGNNRYLTLYDLITDDNGKFLSPDVDLILNRFSGLAQFKHLPALQFLPGVSGGGRRKNKSRKVRK